MNREMTVEKSPEYEALAAAVAAYAAAAAAVLDAMDRHDDTRPSNSEHRRVCEKYPHQHSMDEVVGALLAWRDSLAADITTDIFPTR